MIKKEKKKTSLLKKNPYMFYITNWGFIQQMPEEKGKNTVQD